MWKDFLLIRERGLCFSAFHGGSAALPPVGGRCDSHFNEVRVQMMGQSLHWFNFLLGKFRPWEQAAINAWLHEEDSDVQEIASRQLGLVIGFFRHLRGASVYLNYAPSFLYGGEFPEFSSLPLEKQMAEVQLSINGQNVKCQVWAIRGHIAILEFSKLPRRIPRSAEVQVLGVKTGPFKSDRKRDELAASLPADYVEVAGGPSDKLEQDGIGIMNLDLVYTVNLDSGEYWMLAEKPDIGMLGVPTEGDGRVVWFLYYDGREPRRLSSSFREALALARDIE